MRSRISSGGKPYRIVVDPGSCASTSGAAGRADRRSARPGGLFAIVGHIGRLAFGLVCSLIGGLVHGCATVPSPVTSPLSGVDVDRDRAAPPSARNPRPARWSRARAA